MQRNPKSMLKLSRDVIMQTIPNFHMHMNGDYHHVEGLIPKETVLQLSQDRILKNKPEAQRNVLKYLLVTQPIIGMMYGAGYGILELFHAAKRSYFKQKKIENWRYADNIFKNIIKNDVIKHAIRGGNLKIYKCCCKYLQDDCNDNDFLLELAVSCNNIDFVNHMIDNGASLQVALRKATELENGNIIKFVILKCYDDNEVKKFLLNDGITLAIENNKYEMFKLYLNYNGIDLTHALMTAVNHDNTVMVDDLIMRGATDTNNNCLSYAIYNKNVDIINKLLRQLHYDPLVLISFITKSIRQSIVTNTNDDVTDLIVDLLLDYIPNELPCRYHLLTVTKHQDRILYKYIKRKWDIKHLTV